MTFSPALRAETRHLASRYQLVPRNMSLGKYRVLTMQSINRHIFDWSAAAAFGVDEHSSEEKPFWQVAQPKQDSISGVVCVQLALDTATIEAGERQRLDQMLSKLKSHGHMPPKKK